MQSLEAGADDYLTKPFDMQVLNARIRAVVRRFITSGTGSGVQMGFEPVASSRTSASLDTNGIPEVLGPSPGLSNLESRPERATPRVEKTGAHQLRIGTLLIDTARLTSVVDGEEIHLTPTELRILLLLTDQPGHVYSREKIAYTVWGYEWAGDSRVVDVHIQRLRKKIGSELIETVRGYGYRFAG